MRILAIRGKNLASLAGTFEVDFQQDPLASAGLFAISGPTGAGKSTLLDALCLALYGDTPRLKTADKRGVELPDVKEATLAPSDPRTLLRRGTAEGYAEVDFIGHDGIGYRAHWSVRRAHSKADKKLQGTEMALYLLDNGHPIGSHLKTEVLKTITEKIGLSFDQFTRAVLLAQNEFFTFLKANDDERAALLQTLTGTDRFEVISQRAFIRYRAEESALQKLQEKLADQNPLNAETRTHYEQERVTLNSDVTTVKVRVDTLHAHLRWHQNWEAASTEEIQQQHALQNALAYAEAALQRRLYFTRVEAIQSARSLVADVDRINTEVIQLKKSSLDAEEQLTRTALAHEQSYKALSPLQAALAKAEQTYQDFTPLLQRARHLDIEIQALTPRHHQAHVSHEEAKAAVQHAQKQIKEHTRTFEHAQKELHRLETWNHAHSSLQPLAEGWMHWDTLFSEAADTVYALEQSNHHLQKIRHTPALVLKAFQLGNAPSSSAQHALLEEAEHCAQTLRACQEHLQRIAQQKPTVQAQLEQAERAWRVAFNASQESVEHLRAQLEPDMPCPVCGAIEHPYVNPLSPHPALAHTEVTLRAMLEDCKKKLDTLSRDETTHTERLQDHQERLARISAQIQALQQEHHNNLEQRLDELLDKLENVQGQHAPSNWRSQWKAEPAAYRQARREEAETWLNSQHTIAALRQQIHALEATRSGTQTLLENAERVQQQAHVQFNSIHQELVAKQQERLQIFAGTAHAHATAAELEQHLNHTIQQQRKRLDDHQVELATVAQHLNQATVLRNELLSRHTERELAYQQAVSTLEHWLEQFNRSLPAQEEKIHLTALRALLAHDNEWLNRERQALQQLDTTIEREKALYDAVQVKRQALEAHRPTPETAETLHQALSTLTEELENLQRRVTQIDIELVQDDALKQRAAETLKAIEAQEQTTRIWAQMNNLIGSADGKKFRNIAQRMTLDILLAEANVHLQMLARRYRLERVPNTLALMVIDQDMGNEYRSVHSLSGGESFLVSLGLALGLASLSSHRVRVESLFIDEGFGSLDADTLRIAMDALDSLQSLGRKVGIISHVHEMTERIGTQIQVNRLAGGQSRLSVIGQ